VNQPPRPRFEPPTLASDGKLILRWSTVAGIRYRLESTESLAAPNWQPVAEIEAAGKEAEFKIPLPADKERYYRVGALP